MSEHKCNKEKEIGVISQKVISIEKKLFGNGVKGLISRMEDVLEYINQQKGREDVKGRIESWSRNKLILYGTIGGSILIVFLNLLIEAIKNKLGW